LPWERQSPDWQDQDRQSGHWRSRDSFSREFVARHDYYHIEQEQEGTMRRLRVGVLGAGRIGRVHAENLAYRVRGASVAAIADVMKDTADKLGADLHVAAVYSDPAAIFADKSIDAVAICTSTDTHASLIEQAAAAGKHIFCEKPIALNLATIDRALAAVDKAGVKLQIGFNRRFDPSFKRLREMVAAGEIGQPHILHIISRDPAPPPIRTWRFMTLTWRATSWAARWKRSTPWATCWWTRPSVKRATSTRR
jgi:predicted dehydrogenase